jgi:hypothetical protein
LTIRFLAKKEIDLLRWDACVAADPTCLPYALSWWLDAATGGNWDGVVIDDYRVVMPLPRGKYLGRYTQVQRPSFTQQCGPFGQLQPGDVKQLLTELPTRYLSLKLPFTDRVIREEVPTGFSSRERTNYVLDLSPEYTVIHQGFHKVLRRKLRRNGPATLSPAEPEQIIEIYRQSAGQKAGLKPKHYRQIAAIIEAAQKNVAAICCRLDDDENGFLAAGFFPFYRGRLINTFAASTPTGYAKEGMARMIVELIKAHGGPNTLLDFEGSDIPGVAEFFRSFGPVERNYLAVEKTGMGQWIGKL